MGFEIADLEKAGSRQIAAGRRQETKDRSQRVEGFLFRLRRIRGPLSVANKAKSIKRGVRGTMPITHLSIIIWHFT